MVGRKRALRLALDALPLSRPRPDRVLRPRAVPVARPFEAATDEIRDEFLARPRDRGGLHALHLLPAGRAADTSSRSSTTRRAGARSTCTRWGSSSRRTPPGARITMALLEGAPQPDQPGRTPSAMFSLLKPGPAFRRTRACHNVRLVSHLPLIIPEKCGFRVGNETRHGSRGEALVVRRHDRARGVERERQAARRPALRRLASAPHRAGARTDHGPGGRPERIHRGGAVPAKPRRAVCRAARRREARTRSAKWRKRDRARTRGAAKAVAPRRLSPTIVWRSRSRRNTSKPTASAASCCCRSTAWTRRRPS